MFCRSCGATIQDGATFCGACGTPVSSFDAKHEAAAKRSQPPAIAGSQDAAARPQDAAARPQDADAQSYPIDQLAWSDQMVWSGQAAWSDQTAWPDQMAWTESPNQGASGYTWTDIPGYVPTPYPAVVTTPQGGAYNPYTTSSGPRPVRSHTVAKIIAIFAAIVILAGVGFIGWRLFSRYGEFSAYRNVSDKVTTIETRYEKNGYVPEDKVDDVLDDVANYASSLKATGDLTDYRKNDDCVFMMFKSGLAFVYIPTTEYLAAGGSSTDVMTLQPSYDSIFKAPGLDSFADITDKIGSDCLCGSGSPTAQAYATSQSLHDQSVDLDAVKNLTTAQVVIWQGHGCYDDVLGSILITGQKTDYWSYVRSCLDPSDSDYADTFNYGSPYRSVIMTSSGYYAVSAGYLESHLEGRFDDDTTSVVFLGTCSSAKAGNNGAYELVQAFLDAGADAVFACDDDIYSGYAIQMANRVFTNMSGNNTDEPTAMGAFAALQLAQGQTGTGSTSDFSSDSAWASHQTHLDGNGLGSSHGAAHVVCFVRGSDGRAKVASDGNDVSLTVR